MANGSTTTAIVLKVACGQKLTTTINGAAVQIECAGEVGAGPWTFPEPPSGAGGVLGIVEIAADAPRLDFNEVVEAFLDDRLHDEAVPLQGDESASVLFEGSDGTYASLDSMITDDDSQG